MCLRYSIRFGRLVHSQEYRLILKKIQKNFLNCISCFLLYTKCTVTLYSKYWTSSSKYIEYAIHILFPNMKPPSGTLLCYKPTGYLKIFFWKIYPKRFFTILTQEWSKKIPFTPLTNRIPYNHFLLQTTSHYRLHQ